MKNQNNTRKLAEPLVVTVAAAVIAGTLGIMTSAEGCTIARYVGVKYSASECRGRERLRFAGSSYSFSDPPMVLLNGETITEYSSIYPDSTVENIKTGELTMCRQRRYCGGTEDSIFNGTDSSSDFNHIIVKEK